MKAFEELKLGKKSKYIIFTLNDKKTEIIVEKVSLGGDYDDFVEDLPGTECRWGVFDLEFKKDGEGEGKRNKLIFVSWYVVTIFPFIFFQQSIFFFSFCCMRAYLGLRLLAIVGHPRARRSRTRWWPPLPEKRFGALSTVSGWRSRPPNSAKWLRRRVRPPLAARAQSEITTHFLLPTAVVEKAKRVGN